MVGMATAEPSIKGKTVEYKAYDVEMKGYLAYDENIQGKRPGVLVVHEWWGLNGGPFLESNAYGLSRSSEV
jgi:dienelactone hydrolase